MPKKAGMEAWKKKRRQEHLEKGNPKLAIRYAKRIIKDGQGRMPTDIAPGTTVYELVEELVKYLPGEKKNRFAGSV